MAVHVAVVHLRSPSSSGTGGLMVATVLSDRRGWVRPTWMTGRHMVDVDGTKDVSHISHVTEDGVRLYGLLRFLHTGQSVIESTTLAAHSPEQYLVRINRPGFLVSHSNTTGMPPLRTVHGSHALVSGHMAHAMACRGEKFRAQ